MENHDDLLKKLKGVADNIRSRHPSAIALEDQLLGLVDEYAKEMATKSEKDRIIIKAHVCGFLGKLYGLGFMITLPNSRPPN